MRCLGGVRLTASRGADRVSELVANAVVHSGSRCLRVTVSRAGPRWVRIAVIDKSRTLSVLRAADADDESGRGLGIVEALSDRWGTDRLPWAETRLGRTTPRAQAVTTSTNTSERGGARRQEEPVNVRVRDSTGSAQIPAQGRPQAPQAAFLDRPPFQAEKAHTRWCRRSRPLADR
ncbi:ATP-binding protein [Streptomyces sp. RTd22]|uniref:ATP-binding protein n=1 Tax=Streptomyces sp. RTd22 TaxID=1841249 RepID=UPI000A81EC18|nr:ATP-binding protein [Streptomyces sp. RTd22]